MRSSYDAVIFDFSGVMVSSAFEMMALVAPDHPADVVLDLLMGPYHEDTDHHWHQVERGEIGLLDWITWLMPEAEKQGIDIDLSRLQSLLSDLVPQEPMLEACRAVRARGLKTSLLTNNVAEGSDHWRDVIPLDELFDDVVDSSAVGMRKPNPAIYVLALERLGGVEPGRAVFLDDAPGNVEGARRAGLHALHVIDAAASAAELESLLDS